LTARRFHTTHHSVATIYRRAGLITQIRHRFVIDSSPRVPGRLSAVVRTCDATYPQLTATSTHPAARRLAMVRGIRSEMVRDRSGGALE
jgi:hypothetical protein